MKAFEMQDYSLQIDITVWGLLPFKAILKRDKSRNKEMAFKEMLFIYFYTDIRSDYIYIINDKERCAEIIKDIGLPSDWKIDSIIQTAIDFYNERSCTVNQRLYKSALKSANDIAEYLEDTDVLLKERTDKGATVTTLPMIVAAQEKLPKIMQNLKAAEKEVLKEITDIEGKNKGSQKMNMFELGI